MSTRKSENAFSPKATKVRKEAIINDMEWKTPF